ncbi:hypothetical protein I4F81_011437 [Pyropia yezoensis]|uniref:Uncharacterized protein n=1 Tax=Pyropia yezoensis TaxID=2788 RepID=A0ACC3CGA3_PYRYE|nr:hypothetical protein I4F81_011437 [Neopyropia yezoensis]
MVQAMNSADVSIYCALRARSSLSASSSSTVVVRTASTSGPPMTSPATAHCHNGRVGRLRTDRVRERAITTRPPRQLAASYRRPVTVSRRPSQIARRASASAPTCKVSARHHKCAPVSPADKARDVFCAANADGLGRLAAYTTVAAPQAPKTRTRRTAAAHDRCSRSRAWARETVVVRSKAAVEGGCIPGSRTGKTRENTREA